MVDNVTATVRSRIMAQVKSKNTKPELKVRRFLHGLGYRYRLHRTNLPGKPDIVLAKHKAVILVHGCFWHRHGCRKTTTPKTRREFWIAKFQENKMRDKRNLEALFEAGWRVMVVWECSLMGKTSVPNLIADQLHDFLNSDVRFLETEISSSDGA